MSSAAPVRLINLGGSVYAVEDDQGQLGQVRPSPFSSASKPRWVAYRLNNDGYLGPLGTNGWGRSTRREAIEQLVEATR